MTKPQMTSRERVLTALRREIPDRVPWMEGITGNGIASAVCGEPVMVDWSVAPDGFPTQRGAQLAEEQKKVNCVFGKDNIQFSAFAPVFAHKMQKEKQVVASFTKLFISHSDGDMTPVLDAWIELGQDAIQPIQPDVMDIDAVKRSYGDRVAIVGNIFMDDLVHSTLDQVDLQVRDRIATIGKGGGYIISSSNSLTDDMNPANIRAMIDAIDRYGWY